MSSRSCQLELAEAWQTKEEVENSTMKTFITLTVLNLFVFSLVRADSCQGRCGQGLNSAFSCQCNTACRNYGDCCTDYSSYCEGETCAGRCDTEDLHFNCQCDSTCNSFGDCCTDYQELCSLGTCSSRCGQGFDASASCQCNAACSTHGDCCHDYASLCQSNGAGGSGSNPGSDPLSGIMTDLWLSDGNRMSSSEVQINQGGSRLFTHVNTTKLTSGTYQLFIELLNNYNHKIGVAELIEASERQEVDNFLNAILATEVMELAYEFLLSQGKVSNRANFKEALMELWFNFYPRSSSNNIVDSSGFEHVMVGELKDTSSVSGFHSWIQFYLEEQAGRLSYVNMVSQSEPNIKGAAFWWNGAYKSKGSFFLGTSPEFDLAVYSICAMLYPGSRCNFILQDNSVSIQTYDINHKAGLQIGTAYPAI